MRIYSVTVTGTSSEMLKESAQHMPLRFIVKCPNDESRVQCFNKISRKFKNKYGVVIESADIRLVNEGLLSRLKAKWDGKKAEWNAPKGKEDQHREEAKRVSIFKSIRSRILDMFDDIENDLEKLGIDFDNEQNVSSGNTVVTLRKHYKNAKERMNTFLKSLKHFSVTEYERLADEAPEGETKKHTVDDMKEGKKLKKNPRGASLAEKRYADKMTDKAIENAKHTAEGEETKVTRVTDKDVKKKKDPFAPAPFFS